jgi:hypothetical protein
MRHSGSIVALAIALGLGAITAACTSIPPASDPIFSGERGRASEGGDIYDWRQPRTANPYRRP